MNNQFQYWSECYGPMQTCGNTCCDSTEPHLSSLHWNACFLSMQRNPGSILNAALPQHLKAFWTLIPRKLSIPKLNGWFGGAWSNIGHSSAPGLIAWCLTLEYVSMGSSMTLKCPGPVTAEKPQSSLCWSALFGFVHHGPTSSFWCHVAQSGLQMKMLLEVHSWEC